MPSNQQQIIEQAKFTYSLSGNAFEKQTKTFEDQGEKQIDGLEALKPKELKPKVAKPTEHDNYFLNGLAEIRKSVRPINFYDLTYNFKDPKIAPIRFIDFKVPNHIFKSIHDGNITLEEVEKDQKRLKSELGHINQGPKYNKSSKTIRYNKKY